MIISNDASESSRLRLQVQQHLQEGRLEEARSALEALIDCAPKDMSACLQLSDVMTRLGQWRESSVPLLRAVECLPNNHPSLVLELLQKLVQHGETVAARLCLDALAQAPNQPSGLLMAQAHFRFTLGEILSARELAERALKAGADGPNDLYLYAMLLQFSGEMSMACRVLTTCLKRWPNHGVAAMVLADLHEHMPKQDLLPGIDAQLSRMPDPQGNPGQQYVQAAFEHARFKLLDDAGCHDEAWPALARSNALMSKVNPYDKKAVEAMVDSLIKFSPTGQTAPGAATHQGPIPVFIVGLPRSGTTLLDRMLSSHPRITSAGELHDFWNQLHWVADVQPGWERSLQKVAERCAELDFGEVGGRYLEQTQWRAGESQYYIDKWPMNFQMIAFIRRALPEARIVHISRPPMDVCFSNFKAMFGNSHSYSYDQEALAHYFQQYVRLVEHWQAKMPDAMLEISYTSLVESPRETIEGALAHLGLAMDAACLHPERNNAPVATPSNVQVRSPIHTKAGNSWRTYAEHLQPLQQSLANSSTSAAVATKPV